ncbi:MAG: hypothetical protein RAK25_06910, partial [TACK group archaeon]|nr:hypothetical protein [TACK group archaeon]
MPSYHISGGSEVCIFVVMKLLAAKTFHTGIDGEYSKVELFVVIICGAFWAETGAMKPPIERLLSRKTATAK